MAKRKRAPRKRYSDKQRAQILAAANKQGLTAAAVQKKFGVTPVTYYSWRKKTGAVRRRGRRPSVAGRNGSLSGSVQTEVQARMRALLPKLVEAEVKRYLDAELGTGGHRRRR